jgi:hypothetical protein
MSRVLELRLALFVITVIITIIIVITIIIFFLITITIIITTMVIILILTHTFIAMTDSLLTSMQHFATSQHELLREAPSYLA